MSWACACKLIAGYTGGTLVPTGKTTRAEMAQILSRFCKQIPSAEQMEVKNNWESFVSSGSYKSYIKESETGIQPQQYVISDLNSDGIFELLLMGKQSWDEAFGNTWVFSLQNATPVLVDDRYGYGEYHYSPKYNSMVVAFPTRPSTGTGTIVPFYSIADTKLIYLFDIMRDGTMGTGLWYYADDNGQKVISEQEGMAYLEGRQSFDWQTITPSASQPTFDILDGYWENMIQSHFLYKFQADGTCREYQVELGVPISVDTLKYSRSIPYKMDGQVLVL